MRSFKRARSAAKFVLKTSLPERDAQELWKFKCGDHVYSLRSLQDADVQQSVYISHVTANHRCCAIGKECVSHYPPKEIGTSSAIKRLLKSGHWNADTVLKIVAEGGRPRMSIKETRKTSSSHREVRCDFTHPDGRVLDMWVRFNVLSVQYYDQLKEYIDD
jgi:hypothetical protein